MKALIVALVGAAMYCASSCRAEITVSNAWARATVPGQAVAGVYLKIVSTAPAWLVGGSSPDAKAVELHKMSLENNVMKMRPLARLALPAGKAVELKSGSYHLMLIDFTRPLVTGESVPLKLTIEEKDGRRYTVDVKAEVGDLVATGGPHGSR